MAEYLYRIIDKDGSELPGMWDNSADRNLEQAYKMVARLNENGEYRPYSLVAVDSEIKFESKYYNR